MQKIFNTFSRPSLYSFSSKLFSSFNYDLVVIGGGPGGYVGAIKAGQLGLKTACIEKRGSLGGTCLNVGCIPSKVLLNISHKYEDIHHLFPGFGISVKNVSVNWGKTIKKKDSIVTSLTKGVESLFRKYKVDYIKGSASFENANTIKVEGLDGKVKTVTAKNIMIASGSDAAPFPGLPFDEKVIISSTGALSLKEIPKKMIVIGGGVIGLELGSVYKRMGSEVTVVEYQNTILPGTDLEIAKELTKWLKKQGMKILTGHKVLNGKNLGNSAEIQIQPVKGGDVQSISADVVLVSIGRRPYTEGLALDKVGVEIDNKGRVKIDKKFTTNVPNVFAIGDVVEGPMLAHKAEEEGIACVENLIGQHGHVNYGNIPSVIYTNPEVGCTGKTEEQLKAEKIEYKKGIFPFLANSRAKCNDQIEGMVKILTDKKTDKILGVHILGPNASEMIAEGNLALEYGMSGEEVARTCHAHPTLSEAFKEACMAAWNKSINF